MNTPITIDAIQHLADPKVFERGKQYYENDSIISPIKRGNRLEAFCHGSLIYRVTANIIEGRINTINCTCPYDWGGICKHQVALLLTYLYEPKTFTSRPTIANLLAMKAKDDLVDLIEDMMEEYPLLIRKVDTKMDIPEELFWQEDEY